MLSGNPRRVVLGQWRDKSPVLAEEKRRLNEDHDGPCCQLLDRRVGSVGLQYLCGPRYDGGNCQVRRSIPQADALRGDGWSIADTPTPTEDLR